MLTTFLQGVRESDAAAKAAVAAAKQAKIAAVLVPGDGDEDTAAPKKKDTVNDRVTQAIALAAAIFCAGRFVKKKLMHINSGTARVRWTAYAAHGSRAALDVSRK